MKTRITEKFLSENIRLTSDALPGSLHCLKYSKKLENMRYDEEGTFGDRLNDVLVKKGLLNVNLCLTVKGYHFFN